MTGDKRKNSTRINWWSAVLQAHPFEYQLGVMPREFTRQMSQLVQYPKLINDVGRTVDVTRLDDNVYAFEIRQKRYLGRGNYAISARAMGTIRYDEQLRSTMVHGIVRLGGQYTVLLSIMAAFVLLSLALITVTVLYIPMGVLLVAIIVLHAMYLRADRRAVLDELQALVTTVNQPPFRVPLEVTHSS